MTTSRFTNARVFDGDVVHDHATLVVEEGRVVSVERATSGEGLDCRGLLLAPGFVDLQVNGGADLLFGSAATAERLRRIVAAHEALGTTHLVPTVISGSDEDRRAAHGAVTSVIADGDVGGAVLGVHYEGPIVAPSRRGAHPPVASPHEVDDVDDELWRLPRGGVVRLTLAPEVAAPGTVRRLCAAGVLVAVGHTDATAEQTRVAIADGARCATHLFNAMTPPRAREPGAVGAFLDDDHAWVSVIADGVHVDPSLLRIATRAKPPGKLFAVSDAMPPVGGTPRRFELGGKAVTVDGARCVMADGTLAGSALPLAAAVRVLVADVGVPLEDALRMVSRHPAEYAGVGGRLGRLAPGYEATATILDDDLDVRGVIRAGEIRWR